MKIFYVFQLIACFVDLFCNDDQFTPKSAHAASAVPAFLTIISLCLAITAVVLAFRFAFSVSSSPLGFENVGLWREWWRLVLRRLNYRVFLTEDNGWWMDKVEEQQKTTSHVCSARVPIFAWHEEAAPMQFTFFTCRIRPLMTADAAAEAAAISASMRSRSSAGVWSAAPSKRHSTLVRTN
ncbi:hypothetical protein GPALN_010771 [Globodera pallida]|nr:hypothetical protein GPALN_010771 [Globodera pallida]